MLKFLLIFFIVLYVLGYLGRLFLRNWIKKMSGHSFDNSDINNKRKEGDVTINVNSDKSKKFKENDGEYVDYEEVN